jgi:hypothetical protein
MLILAEGSIHRPIEGSERSAVQAWLGPMVDGGFLQNAYIDGARLRLWMVLSSDTQADAERRLNDLPVVRDGSVTFALTHISAVRFL